MSRLRILVSGMIASTPGQGGAVWAVLQYVLGLRALGCDVFFLEAVEPESIQPVGATLPSSQNAAYFKDVRRSFGLDGKAALISPDAGACVGIDPPSLRKVCARADVLLNLSGVLKNRELLDRIPVRVYLDLDPGFTQLWHAVQGIDMGFDGHTHFVSVGQLIGREACPVPTCGLLWIPTPQPAVLDRWPPWPEQPNGAYTSVGNWRGYGSIKHEGVLYGQRAHSFRRFMNLPRQTKARFKMALAIHPEETADLAALAQNGWSLTDPAETASTPEAYRQFIRNSRAELGVAKSGYEEARCGWFSDRSICYLASGRPVIAQDTRFADFLPTGQGLFSFASVEEAAAAIAEIESDYSRHSRKAAEIAREFFDSNRVLNQLLRRIGVVG